MINNSKIRNVSVSFPAIEGLGLTETLGKVRIKNIYQQWNGESVNQIREKHETNPYTLRIGLPAVDERLKNDAVYFVLDYLSYNPLTKQVERRELIPLRNMETVYIGQSVDEKVYKDYKLFVDGNAVVDDLYIKKFDSIKDQSIGKLLTTMVDKIEKLQQEVLNLKRELISKHIYKQ
jgi:hypothetical protein